MTTSNAATDKASRVSAGSWSVCHPDYDVYYVNVGIGMTHIDPARDLRLRAAVKYLPVERSLFL